MKVVKNVPPAPTYSILDMTEDQAAILLGLLSCTARLATDEIFAALTSAGCDTTSIVDRNGDTPIALKVEL